MKKIILIIVVMLLLPALASAQSMVLRLNGKDVISSPVILADPSLAGDLTFLGGGTITTTANGNLVFDPNGSGFTIIGSTAPAGFTYVTPDGDDLGVSGDLDLRGALHVQASSSFYGYLYLHGGAFTIKDGNFDSYGGMSNSTDDGLKIVVGKDSGKANRHLLFVDSGNWNVGFGAGTLSDNIIGYWTSSESFNNTKAEYFTWQHSGADAYYATGRGGYIWGVDNQPAQGTMTLTGQPIAAESFVINATTVTAVAAGAAGDQFNIGADTDETCTNIIAAVNAGTEAANVHAYRGTGTTIIFEWKAAGVAGNIIVFTEGMTNTAVDGGGTLGGTHAGVDADASIATLDETGAYSATSVQGDHYSDDGTQGITDATSYWFCTAADCSTRCQATIKDGLIVGCP